MTETVEKYSVESASIAHKEESSSDALDGVQTQRWSSRWAFVAACCASAVGLGNVWRFPYLCYKYGGATYFLPYLICLFFVGVPLLTTELTFGQVWQANNVRVFWKIDRKCLGIAIGQLFANSIIAAYYLLLMCWCLVYLVNSFVNPLPWTISDAQEAACVAFDNEACQINEVCIWKDGKCQGFILGQANKFFDEAANIGDPSDPQVFSGYILLAFIVCWILVFLIMCWGARVMGRILYFTTLLPLCVMIVLFFVGVTLPGAGEGISAYVGGFDGSKLSDPYIWVDAAAQVFFSISCSEGMMMTYASYNKRDNPCGQDALIIPICDFFFAFISGFAVFGVAGYLAHDAGLPLEELPLQGRSLAFKTYCVGVASLGYPWGQIICVIFFFTLFLLGMGTVPNMLEPLINTIAYSKFGRAWNRKKVVGCICIIWVCVSVIFCVDWGHVLMDELDYFVNDIGLVTIGVVFAGVIGWVFHHEHCYKTVGTTAYLCLAIGYNFSVIIFVTLGAAISHVAYWPGTIIALVGGIGGPIVSIVVAYLCIAPTTESGEVLSAQTKAWWLYLGNTEVARHEFNTIIAPKSEWWTMKPLTILWTMCLKYLVVPGLSTMMAVQLVQEETWSRNNEDDNVPVVYSVISLVITVVLTLLPIAIGAFFPSTFEFVCSGKNEVLLVSEYPAGYEKEKFEDTTGKV